MSELATYALYAIGIAGMFLLLIGPHEAGHFLAAKLFKVRVLEFSIGAGTKLWSATRGGTLYALRLLPILGYVRMGGMEAGDFEGPNGFHSKAPLKRIAILAAGPVANFLVAMVLIAGFFMTQLNSVPGLVIEVIPSWSVSGQTLPTPAAAAGLRAGDRIRSVNGAPVTAPDTIQQQEAASKGQPVVVSGTHADGTPFTVTLAPVCSSAGCRMGVSVALITTPLTALKEGVTFPFTAAQTIFAGLGSLVTGQVKGGLLGRDGLTGPIGIAKITTDAVSAGPPTYLWLVALLSVALGVTNLLPLLALDGGRIVVVILEWVRRRPFDCNSELNFQRWGMVALLALAAVISFLDIQRLATGSFPGVH
jgi:regulator of sigma E protease